MALNWPTRTKAMLKTSIAKIIKTIFALYPRSVVLKLKLLERIVTIALLKKTPNTIPTARLTKGPNSASE